MATTRPKRLEGVDLRRLPRAKRPRPTTGQSAPARQLAWEDLRTDEPFVVRSMALLQRPLEGAGAGAVGVAQLAARLRALVDPEEWPTRAKLRVRNAIRRLVQGGWLERVAAGTYRLPQKA